MRNRIVLICHGDESLDDRVPAWVTKAGYITDVRRPFSGDILGEATDDIAGTFLYGGKYNDYQSEGYGCNE